MDSRRPSIQDELLNNLLNDITEPNIQIPSVTESNTYFAPISPANTTNNTNATTNGVKLLEMLQRKSSQNGQGDVANPVIPVMKNCSIKDLGKKNDQTNVGDKLLVKHERYKFSFFQKLMEKCTVWKN